MKETMQWVFNKEKKSFIIFLYLAFSFIPDRDIQF